MKKGLVSVMSLSAAAFLRPAETLVDGLSPGQFLSWAGLLGVWLREGPRAASAPPLQGARQPSCLLSFLHLPPELCPQLTSLMSHLYHQSSALVSPLKSWPCTPALTPSTLKDSTVNPETFPLYVQGSASLGK